MAVQSHELPADVLFRNFTPIGCGIGNTRKKLIDWNDCAQHHKYLKPPYSVQKRGGDCKNIDPAMFGLRRSSLQGSVLLGEASYTVDDPSIFRSLFPDAEIGDAVSVTQRESGVTLRSKDRGIILPRSEVAEGPVEFANDLSIAVGLYNSKRDSDALQVIASASGTLKAYPSEKIFKTREDVKEAANLLSQLSTRQDDVGSSAHYLFVDLAVARSRALTPPPPPPSTGSGAVFIRGSKTGIPKSHFTDAHLFLGPGQFGFKLGPGYEDVLTGVFIDDSSIYGGYQELDSIRWNNVTFVGTKIIYNGGPVSLKGVRFYNCTFEIRTGREGNVLLKYASIDPAEVNTSIETHGE
jgi:hypothetical protein